MLLTRESTPNTWTTQEAFRIDRDRQAYIKLVQKMSVRVLDVQGQKPQGLHLLMSYCRDGFFFLPTIGVGIQSFQSFNDFTD